MVSRERVRDIVTIVAATRTEANAVRRAAPANVRVVECGISALRASAFDDLTISCGLAGGLRADLPTGTVLIPSRVRRPDGSEFDCDAAAIDALTRAARDRGYPVVHDPLVTTRTLVHREERRAWGSRGYAGADMETGLLNAPRVACVRVVLDTPQREISPAWLRPATALLQPRAWVDVPFLIREGPRCAAIAAYVACHCAEFLA